MRFKKKVASNYLISDTKRIVTIFLGFVILFFLLYFGYQIVQYFVPPKVVILEPKTQIFKHIDKIKVIGKTEKEASITIYGERVYQNKEGFFEYDFPLHDGKNVLHIEIIGANGKKTVLNKEFTKE